MGNNAIEFVYQNLTGFLVLRAKRWSAGGNSSKVVQSTIRRDRDQDPLFRFVLSFIPARFLYFSVTLISERKKNGRTLGDRFVHFTKILFSPYRYYVIDGARR